MTTSPSSVWVISQYDSVPLAAYSTKRRALERIIKEDDQRGFDISECPLDDPDADLHT
jgi:hypothetical protein